MTPPTNLVTWLQERTALNILSEEVLEAIASSLEERSYSPQQTLVKEETTLDGMYLLLEGRVESNKPLNASQSKHPVSLLPGCAIGLRELLLHQPTQETVVTQSDSQFLFLCAERFQELVEQYPEISRAIVGQLSEEVESLASQLNAEQERQTLLRPYLVTKAKRGIIGKSRYAVRLRKQVKQASEDRQSVLIFGEPGLEKDNIAALIHYGSDSRREAIAQINCNLLQSSGAELFGREGGKPGLIAAVGRGTLVLNNIQELPAELIEPIAQWLATGHYKPVSRPAETATQKTSEARIIAIAEQVVPDIACCMGHSIKVPPLRVRKGDIADQVNYYLSLMCRARGISKPRLTLEALRRLQAYDFPNNLRELESLVRRAMTQLSEGGDLTEEIIWPSQSKKKQFRLNLLNTYPALRKFLRSPWWPDRLNYGFTFTAFAIVVALLFLGPQTRDRNFALNFFWCWWWPLILLGFPFVGRLWCAVCPFMIYGEVTQKLSLWLFPRQLKRWPRQAAEQWGGWFLYGLFALILLWEELWNLENTAYLSAWLLLLITAGAMICSAIFERRFWCRYLCPIGGMNGMFAKLSMTELRAQQGTCSAECTTYQCYKGGPQKGEGQETDGCPLYSHPAQLEDNRDCVLCMTCLKACPHRSVEVNLRPPGIELWTTHVPHSYEVALLWLLLGAVFLHHLPELQTRFGLNFDLAQFDQHSILAAAALFLPVLIPVLGYGALWLLFRLFSPLKSRNFVTLSYGYLPLVLAANLAHYLPLGLGEGGRIIPVSFATFGLNGAQLPIWVVHPAAIAFLQGITLIAGVLLSIWLTQKIARQPLRWLLPQHLSAIALGIACWQIIL